VATHGPADGPAVHMGEGDFLSVKVPVGQLRDALEEFARENWTEANPLRGELRQWAIRTLEQGASSYEPTTPDQIAYLVTLMRNGLSALEFWTSPRE
jgi:hypothetical protein